MTTDSNPLVISGACVFDERGEFSLRTIVGMADGVFVDDRSPAPPNSPHSTPRECGSSLVSMTATRTFRGETSTVRIEKHDLQKSNLPRREMRSRQPCAAA